MTDKENIYYYPENLNQDATLLFWSVRNAMIIAVILVVGILAYVWMGVLFPFAFTVIFAFMTFQIADTTVYDYTKLLVKYVIVDKLILHYDEGGNPMIPRKNTCEKEMNIAHITDNYMQLINYKQRQVYIFIKPINVVVLPPEYMRLKIECLANSIKSVAENNIQIEILCVNSTQSYEENKEYLVSRIQQEKNILLRQLLQKDLLDLDKMKINAAANREFVFVLNFGNGESQATMNNLVNRVVAALNDGGFSAKIAKQNDYKRINAIYYEQRLDVEDLLDYDGEQFLSNVR